AALSTFEVDLPEKGLRVDVTPSLGVTANPDAAGGKTHVTAYLGSGDAPVSVTWYPKPKETPGAVEKPSVYSELWTALRLDEGVAKAVVRANYTVEQAPTDTFRLKVPAGWKVLDVSAEPMKRASDFDEATGVVRIEFHERLKSAKVAFRLERTVEGAGAFDFPIVKTLDVERETGLLAAASSS